MAPNDVSAGQSLTPVTHISLEQWRALVAVVEAGGYAQAAELLHKSQSAVTYGVQKIAESLGVEVFSLQGRRAVLTPTGHLLYRRALALITEAADLERAARTLSAGWEAEIGLAVEILFPTRILLAALGEFGEESPHTRVEIIESVLGGTPEALLKGQAELAISPRVPPGFLGDLLMELSIQAVAAPGHPLFALGREITHRDLQGHRHLTVRDTGAHRDRRAVTVEVERRWTVSHLSTAIEAVKAGHGFAWFPVERIAEDLAQGRLQRLPLREGRELRIPLYLVLADPDFAGPGVRRLAEILRARVAQACAEREEGRAGERP